uniref:Glycosyl transferase family 25 domain-containing protein n=1 Tax=viral metagenome TaxID=1070528 RepID=A0A6C0I1M6_9ZZZZ
MGKTVGIYVVNFMDDARRQRMTDRFKALGLDCHFIHPITTDDERIKDQDIIPFCKRSWAILFQHVDSIRQFYETTTYDYCIVCEDDIYISRSLNEELPKIIDLFESANLDILLLSYLWPYTVVDSQHFPLKKQTDEFKLHGYPNDLWGAHMYMVSRNHAKSMIERFTKEYAEVQKHPTPFCSDWQITKFGERALLVPMVGVEEGGTKTDHDGQNNFHQSCFEFNYSADRFV